ncbi:MAG TPA: response regulator transcription factor [Spirochaetia bacterium]|jgi:DNA-binding NarL/FixJ family response regulator|nr:response regulator transcription factor [Spirochaetia bacterium]
MNEHDKTRVLLVDDQALFAASLKTFLENYANDIEVVGTAQNGQEAIELAKKTQPEIVLMDIYMPVMNGVEATRQFKAIMPDIKIIMLSTYDEDEYIKDALANGASGYLLKDISPTELIAAIRALRGGVVQISPQILSKLFQRVYHEGIPKTDELGKKFEWFETLTPREKEIFGLIAIGIDNEEIALKLNIAEQTVRNHVSIIYSKLDVHDRFEIIQLANQLKYH